MRHVTAHISIWNKLGWIGIICYFVFAAAAPEVLTEGNQWIGLCLAVLCVTLISLPWKKPFNAIALAGMVIWIIVTRAIFQVLSSCSATRFGCSSDWPA